MGFVCSRAAEQLYVNKHEAKCTLRIVWHLVLFYAIICSKHSTHKTRNDKPTVEEKKKNESHDESLLHSTKH